MRVITTASILFSKNPRLGRYSAETNLIFAENIKYFAVW